jgi:hypothetical protein
MTISLRADGAGTYGAIQLNGADRLTLNADGTLSGSTAPAQFDASLKLATTDFVKRAAGSISGFSVLNSSQTLTAAHCGQVIELYGATQRTITLPLVSAVGSYSKITFVNFSTVTMTIMCQGADNFLTYASSSNNGLALPPGDSVEIHSFNGWIVTGGSYCLRYSSQQGALIAGSGYQKMSSGIIFQWMPVTTTVFSNGFNYATLPLAFPNAPIHVAITSSPASLGSFGADGYSATQIRFTNSYSGAQSGYAFIIGY